MILASLHLGPKALDLRLVEAGRERGRGYLEMTGYGDRIRVG